MSDSKHFAGADLARNFSDLSKMAAVYLNGAAAYADMLPNLPLEQHRKIVRQIIVSQRCALACSFACSQLSVLIAEAIEGC